MKRNLAVNFVSALAVLLMSTGVAFAKPVKTDLNTFYGIGEMELTEGRAKVDLKKGVVTVKVEDLPEDPDTGDCLPIELTDGYGYGDVNDAVEYEVWLLRAEQVNGTVALTEGLSVGYLEVNSKNASGVLKYKGHEDLRDHGFNMVVVTAEDTPGPHNWVPVDNSMNAFTWEGSPNGVIILWNMF